MGIRVIGGRCRGRRLEVADLPSLRPTTDRMRETIFNILAHRVDFDGLRVLDLYAGSGGLGIEALSRGASCVDFVETNRRAAAVIEQNLASLGLDESGRVHCRRVEQVVDSLGRYDVVLADPPYSLARLEQPLEGIARNIVEDGLLLLEHVAGSPAPKLAGLDVVNERTIAGSSITLYGAESDQEDV